MTNSCYKCLLISDFNLAALAGILGNSADFPHIEASLAPYDQVVPTLIQRDDDCWRRQPDFVVVWTRPESVIQSFKRLVNFEDVPLNDILVEVDDYSDQLWKLRDVVKWSLVPSWVVPSYFRGFGLLDMDPKLGIANILMRMNLRLAENLAGSGAYVLDAQRWLAASGKYACNPKLWYAAKTPFGTDALVEAAKDIRSAVTGITGQARKLIIIDLDDTVWGGTVGEIGWEHLRLGGHDTVGEAYVDFQHALRALTRRGILLGIVSKNDQNTALDAIRRHPEMVLKLEDFAGWKIDWNDKAKNVIDLATELNVGLQSIVFIDDHPVERARIRDTLPEVLVPDWPNDPALYKSALNTLACFDQPSLTTEDRDRTKMYVTDRYREELKSRTSSLDDWIGSLQMRVEVQKLNETNLDRAAQLFNKTNQLSLSTRRLSTMELKAWGDSNDNQIWTFTVYDKFGCSGLTGIGSLEIKDDIAWIVDFVLSCRVMGRNIEEAMVYILVQHAKARHVKSVCARYIATEKNSPCLDFWKRSGFTRQSADIFSWDVLLPYPAPSVIQIDERIA